MTSSFRTAACAALFVTLLTVHAQERTPIRCDARSGLSAHEMQQARNYAADRSLTRYVALHVIIASQPGPGGDAATASKVQRDLDGANALFAHNNAGIQFQLCGPIQVIESTGLYDQNYYDAHALDPYHEPGYITVVYAQYLLNGLTGYTTNDEVFVTGYATPALLAHELGHAMGLMHTHDTFIPEFVDGSNCTVGGDRICDTPAEPDLSQPGLVDRSNCTYIGMLTDAHGDPYAPLMGNIMSYAPCEVDTFTPGQVQVMLYVLEQRKAHLHRTTAPTLIDPFDTRVCRPGSVPLSASPAPGVFSGDLVNSSTVSVTDEAPGVHLVQYQPNATPDSTDHIDQSMVMFTFDAWPYYSVDSDTLAQDFRAGTDGRITSVDLLLHDDAPNTYTLRLFAGSPPDLTLLAITVMNSPGLPDTAWVNFPFAGNIPISEGLTYTFTLSGDHPVRAMISGGGGTSATDYIHGNSNLVNANADFVFRTWVHALPPCTEAVRYYEVYDPPTYPVASLASTYCPDEATPVPLIGQAVGVANSHFLVDGVPATAIVPAALGLGAHTLAYVNTTFGCTDTSAYTFTVARPSAEIMGLQPVLCTDVPPFALAAEPPGGSFTIDGDAATLLDPTAMGLGAHTAVYTFNGPVDSVAFGDQQCCGNDRARFSDNTALAAGGSFWQTFVPAFSGRLDSVNFVITADAVRTYSWGVKLFSGEGIDGTLLGADTVEANTWNAFPDLIGDIHPQIEAGLPYTVRIERLVDTVSIAPSIYFYRFDSYPPGAGSLNSIPQVDLRFQEYVSATYSCAGTTEVPFTILSCSTGIAGTPGGDALLAAPNPFTNAFTLHTEAVVQYELLNSLGAVARRGSSTARTSTVVEASGLAPGCYLLRCTSATGEVRTVRLMHVK